MKLLIIDGHNLLFQMFFGMPPRIFGKDGRAIHGTLGFTGGLIKMIRMVEPTHLAALFDSEGHNPRTELYAGYKANRIDYTHVPETDNPFSQLQDIYAAMDYMGVFHTEIDSEETDDAAAAYAYKYGGEMEVIIASFDSDFFQLINGNVSILRYRGDKSYFCDEAYIKEKFGISPGQYADFKALAGDPSDNIKGAERVGPKTAAALLRRFGSLEGVIKGQGEIEKPAIRESINQSAERLKTNYELIKLDNQADIPYPIEALEYTYNGITTNAVLEKTGLK